jgi:RNA polymerase sigma-70 factor, ECF subfamily
MSASSLTVYREACRLQLGLRTGLLADARLGSREAFTEIVSPLVPSLHRRARRVTGNATDAQDVSQETLLKAWSRLEQFTGTQDESGDEFRAWLSRIAANTSIDLLRQRKDGKLLSLDEPKGASEDTLATGLKSEQQNPEERFARREMCGLLADAIRKLPRDLRQACLLRDVLHYSTQEVADRLGISLVAVRLRLFRAHRQLRENLQYVLRPARKQRQETAGTRATHHQQYGVERTRERLSALKPGVKYACGD